MLSERASVAVASRFTRLRGIRQSAAYGESPRPAFLGDAVKARTFLEALKRDIEADSSGVLRHSRPGASAANSGRDSLERLLHPVVRNASYPQFQAGQLRDAVLNAFIAVFDLIRSRTGLATDGTTLIAEALSLQRPRLLLGDLTSESGQSDQKGFIQILQGAYLGIRNPKAHSLSHDLNSLTAAQYLVFASLLARRVSEANIAPTANV